MNARDRFHLGDDVELTSDGEAWWLAKSSRGKTPPGADPKRGLVVGFSPRNPRMMHVLREGYRTAVFTKATYWTTREKHFSKETSSR